MTRRQSIEAALEGWRDAERRLEAQAGDHEGTMQEIATYRTEFQRLCAQEIVVSIDAPGSPQVITSTVAVA